MSGNMIQAAGRDAFREQERRLEAARAHMRRCGAVGRPDDREVAKLLADFHARGGRVTVCRPAHLLPVHNGAGREADRWVA